MSKSGYERKRRTNGSAKAARSPLAPKSPCCDLGGGGGCWESHPRDHQVNDAVGLVWHDGSSGLVNRKSGGEGWGGGKQIKDAAKIDNLRV